MCALLTEPLMETDRMPDGHPLLEAGGVCSEEAVAAQQAALAALPPYEVTVRRRQTVGTPVVTDQYQRHEEIAYFSDGAVRRLTRVMPNQHWFGRENTASPIPVMGGDALGTWPHGINRDIIESLAFNGFPVEWLHHQGRDAPWPTNWRKAKTMAHFLFGKSVGRSAHHEHALLDDLGKKGGVSYDTSNVISVGDSRRAMTGEAVDALAPEYNRKVIFGDYIAACFNERPGMREVIKLPLLPVKEGVALGKLIVSTLVDDFQRGNFDHTIEMLGTFDLHPMNVIHELAWIVPLLNADAGKYAAAVPLNSQGVRTLFVDDYMSQHEAWQVTHAARPGVKFFILPGSHFDLAQHENQTRRTERLQRLLQEMRHREFSLLDIDYDYVINGVSSDVVAA